MYNILKLKVTDGTPGFVKCGKGDCAMCQHVSPTTAVKSTVTGFLLQFTIMLGAIKYISNIIFSRSSSQDKLQS